MWHPKDKPYRGSVKAAHFFSQSYGLPEALVVLDTDLPTTEATIDLVLSSRVKFKRYMKYQLGILCLILVPPTPPFFRDAEPLANIPLTHLGLSCRTLCLSCFLQSAMTTLGPARSIEFCTHCSFYG